MEQRYGGKIKKNHQKEVQKLINRQARSITGMHLSTPIAALMSESGLTPAYILLDRKCACRLFSLPDSIPTKDILPITLRVGDGNVQPEDQPEQDAIWVSNPHITTYSQRPARQVSVRFSIDPAKGTKPIRAILRSLFLGKLIIENRNRVILEAKTGIANLNLWCDGLKLDSRSTGVAVVWKKESTEKEWQEQKSWLRPK